MVELKERLAALAKYVPQGSVVIDVGTDHAYLPIYLVQHGRCPRAIGVDVHKGPYQSAVDQVKLQTLDEKITVYWGDGLKPVKPGQGDVAVIAGMGGTTMAEILEASTEVVASLRRLILQPMVAGGALRSWLLKHGWAILDEQLVEEEDRIYEIIVAEPGEQDLPPEVILDLGPRILAKRDPLLPELVRRRVRALESVLREMEKAGRPEVDVKMREIQNKIDQLQEVLK